MLRSTRSTLAAMVLAVTLTTSAHAATIRVPGDQPTIQAGVNGAASGDTIRLSPGTYRGAGNRGINPSGRALTFVGDGAVMDAEGVAPCFRIRGGEATVIVGIVMVNGALNYGGTIFCNGPLTLSHCVLAHGRAAFGGGLLQQSEPAQIASCVFYDDSAGLDGGAVFADGATVTITNTIVVSSGTEWFGCLSSGSGEVDCSILWAPDGEVPCYSESSIYRESPTFCDPAGLDFRTVATVKRGGCGEIGVGTCATASGVPLAATSWGVVRARMAR